MFGFSVLIVKTILIWSVISVVLVESDRQARDVHHMIILQDDVKPLKSYRHKHHVHNRGRSKRKPPRKNKYEHSVSSSEESFEDDSYESYEQSRPHKPKSGSHEHYHNHHPKSDKHHKSQRNNKDQRHKHKHPHSTKDNRIPPESRPLPNGQWTSMNSQELFGNAHHYTPQEFPTTYQYQNGAMHFHRPLPMEITTAHPMFPNAFLQYENTMNNMNPQMSQTLSQSPFSSVDTYKPFDYSMLGQQNVYPTQEVAASGVASVRPTLADAGTTFSIVLNNSAEKNIEGVQKAKNEVVNVNNNYNNKDNRMRARNKFRIRTNGQPTVEP